MTSEKAFSIFGKIVVGFVACYVLLYLLFSVLAGTVATVPGSPNNAKAYRFFWECRGENRRGSPWLPSVVAPAL